MPRLCSLDGCERKHVARGLCGTHYNQRHQPNRHRKVEVQCDTCGALILKDVANSRKARFCSLICRDVYRLDETDGDPMRRARESRTPRMPTAAPPVACALRIVACTQCGDLTAGRPSRRAYCSNTCSNRARKQRRGKRHNIRRESIFIRDQWQCWICETPCDQTARVPHPDAATIDHLVPQSFGGGHEPENLATAHLSCNSRRGASWDYPEAA